jgi:gliding motility-associated-like protein
MNKKHLGIAALLLVFCARFFAQTNLVGNPSFDICSPCPTITGQYNYCTGWLNCNGNVGQGPWGTPDFYHTCGTFNAMYNPVPPNTAIGVVNPHTGGGLMGIVVYNTPYPDYREYLSRQLNCTMNPGTTYTVSFWICVGTQPKYKYNTSHFGIYLSSGMPAQTGWNLINVTPQYEITTIISNAAWAQYSFTINPTSTFNYITMGCFRPDNAVLINNATPTAQNPYSNWYLDDISIVGSGTIPVTFNTNNASCNLPSGSATISSVSGPCTYTWLPGNQTTSVVSNLSPGNYTVQISDGCIMDSKTVSIGSSSTQTLTVNSPSICGAQSVTLQANVSGGTPPFVYQWSNGPTSAANIFTVSNTSVYTCTVTDNNGCVSIKTSTVSLTPLNVNFATNVNPCSGAVNITNQTAGATSYTLNFGDGNTSNQLVSSHSYTQAGNYTITMIAANGTACLDSTKKTVTINSIVHSAFTYTDAICDSIVDLNNLSIGAISAFWDFGDSFTTTQLQPGAHEYSSPGSYTVMLITNPNGACPDTAYHVVNVSYNAISNFSFSLDPCNRKVSFVNLSSNSSNYYWDLGDASTGNFSTMFTHNYVSSSTNSYTVMLIVNPGFPCADTSKRIFVFNNNIGADFEFKTDPCTGKTTFTNESVNANYYTWTFDKIYGSNAFSPMHQFTSSGDHTVTLYSSAGTGCGDSITKIIPLGLFGVIADFDLANIPYSNDVLFTNKSVNAQNYVWDFNDGNWTSDKDPLHTFYDVTKFKVCLAAWNSFGCGDTVCRVVDIKPDWTLYVPNTFTPDEDGLNDFFKAVGTHIHDFKMSVFDRWGQELFVSTDLEKGWNGFYKGKMSQDDVYVWKISFTDPSSKTHQLVRHVLLMK